MTPYKIRKICINCGKYGHEHKQCTVPITSFGIINIKLVFDQCEINDIKSPLFSLRYHFGNVKDNNTYRVKSHKYNDILCDLSHDIILDKSNTELYDVDAESVKYNDIIDLKKLWFFEDKILFMLVSRRFSIGFVSFVRGKYDIYTPETIICLFEQMTEEEIKFIKKNTYDSILCHFLCRDESRRDEVLNNIYESIHSIEYCQSKIKFNLLSNPPETHDIPWPLRFYTTHIKSKWNKPEWGFPKGRRNHSSETDLQCASREFEEETGYDENEYFLLDKIKPIEENIIGTNGIEYRHIYYLALNNKNDDSIAECYDVNEIGEVKWFTYNEAINSIRPYHHRKKKILTSIFLLIINFLIENTELK